MHLETFWDGPWTEPVTGRDPRRPAGNFVKESFLVVLASIPMPHHSNQCFIIDMHQNRLGWVWSSELVGVT